MKVYFAFQTGVSTIVAQSFDLDRLFDYVEAMGIYEDDVEVVEYDTELETATFPDLGGIIDSEPTVPVVKGNIAEAYTQLCVLTDAILQTEGE